MGATQPKRWEADNGLWAVIKPLLPEVERRPRLPAGHPDRLVLQVILFVLPAGIAWEHLPQELGVGLRTFPRVGRRRKRQPPEPRKECGARGRSLGGNPNTAPGGQPASTRRTFSRRAR
ncbi:transposase [Kitasatospora sp. NPDC101157]|uniref:transposase n=1 Tax=Kitasatospora sp. NPDC101157 TaxID=3364098 RepID=UPI00381205D3